MVFQNYFGHMPTPEENLAAKKAELQTVAEEYNSIQQAQQARLQSLLQLQGAVKALQEVVSPTEEVVSPAEEG